MATKAKKSASKPTPTEQQKMKMQKEKWEWISYLDKNNKVKYGRIVSLGARTVSILNEKDPLHGAEVKIYYGRILPEEPSFIP